MLPWLVADLLRCLKNTAPKPFKVAVLPDFFLDRLVTYDGDIEQLDAAFREVARRKGGTIHRVKQTELRGGNAANTASALAALGAKVYPIVSTSPLGLHILRFYLEPFGIDLSHTKTNGALALTTALEFTYKKERVNVMMSDLGSLPEFGLKDLTPEDFTLLQEADYVSVFHWSGMLRCGTELAEGAFRHVKEKGRGKTYFDSADPTPKEKDIPKLLEKVVLKGLIDIFSINENEAFWYASHLGGRAKRVRKTESDALAMEHARVLARKLPVRVDLHTSAFAASLIDETEVIVPTFDVPVLRTTGAGDAWNAGNLFADALALPDACRLTFANAVAAYYISSPEAEHPTLSKLVDFCSKQREI